jgi:hypothetical protein
LQVLGRSVHDRLRPSAVDPSREVCPRPWGDWPGALWLCGGALCRGLFAAAGPNDGSPEAVPTAKADAVVGVAMGLPTASTIPSFSRSRRLRRPLAPVRVPHLWAPAPTNFRARLLCNNAAGARPFEQRVRHIASRAKVIQAGKCPQCCRTTQWNVL